MLTLGQAARLGIVPATGPAVRHATPHVTDAELRHWVTRAEENSIELHSALEDMRSQRDACRTWAQALNPTRTEAQLLQKCHARNRSSGPGVWS
jgi:hypothetical protein